MRPAREHELLATLGHIGLDDADAAQRLGQAARHIGVDLPALAEQRAELRERPRHVPAEHGEDHERGQGEMPVEVEQHAERDHGGHDPACELHQAGADQVPHSLGVGHDARDQDPGLGRVEVAHRQARDVGLHALAHLRDRALRGHPHHLREREGGQRLDQRGAPHHQRQRQEQIRLAFADHVVDQPLGRDRQREPREPAHEHEPEADREVLAVLGDERLRLSPGGAEGDALLGVGHRVRVSG